MTTQEIQQAVTVALQKQQWDQYLTETFYQNLDTRTKEICRKLLKETKNDILTTVKDKITSIDGIVKDLVERYVPANAERKTAQYLRENLKDLVLQHVQTTLPTLLPYLVQIEVLGRLANISGAEQALQEHRKLVKEELEKQNGHIHTLYDGHVQHLQHIKALQVDEFTIKIRDITQEVLQSLVGSNGQIIKAFADELREQNTAEFNNLKVDCFKQLNQLTEKTTALSKDVTQLSRNLDRADNTLTWHSWINTALIVAGLILGYKYIAK